MKSIRDSLMDEGVFCPEHGVDYDLDCETCHNVTREFVLKHGLYIVQMKLMSSPPDLEATPWNSDSFIHYVRDEKAVHEEELEKATRKGDREEELRESGYLQALDFVIDVLLNE